MKKKVTKCCKCKEEIDKKDKVCNKCGTNQYLWAKTGTKIIIILFILMILIVIIIPKDNSENMGLTHGELLDFKETCMERDDENNCLKTIAVIKMKIESSYNNEATINQNYFNIENFIKNNDCSKYSEIQYWAVADMTDGNESKVISFTVPKELIDKIKNDKIAENQLSNYVDDLWVHYSLREDE